MQPEAERWLDAQVNASAAFNARLEEQRERGRDWRKTSVSVYSAPNPKTDHTPISLKDLSDRAQAQAVDFVVKHPNDAEAGWSQLTKTLTGTTAGTDHKDPYRVDRRLVATVVKGIDALPGDRLLWARIFVQPINFNFAGYTVAATDNKAVRVANVENDQNTKLALDPGLFKGDHSVEHTSKVTADLNEQYEDLGIDISPRSLRIFRESGVGTDILGNTFIDLSIITDPALILTTDPDKPNDKDPNDAPVLVIANVHLMDGVKMLEGKDARLTVLPQNRLHHCPLKARVSMLSETRHIVDGRSHMQEGRQRVSLEQEFYVPPSDVTIVPADDISPAVWFIQSMPQDKDGRPVDGVEPEYVKAKTENGQFRQLVFTDYSIASELTHWLKAHQPANETSPRIRLDNLIFNVDHDRTLRPRKETGDRCNPAGQEVAADSPRQ